MEFLCLEIKSVIIFVEKHNPYDFFTSKVEPIIAKNENFQFTESAKITALYILMQGSQTSWFDQDRPVFENSVLVENF
jgi:hypothetical protein